MKKHKIVTEVTQWRNTQINKRKKNSKVAALEGPLPVFEGVLGKMHTVPLSKSKSGSAPPNRRNLRCNLLPHTPHVCSTKNIKKRRHTKRLSTPKGSHVQYFLQYQRCPGRPTNLGVCLQMWRTSHRSDVPSLYPLFGSLRCSSFLIT